MPIRLIREGILSSERVNSLSANAELFYRRLMSVVDDFGRYSANPTLLRASCYPLKLDSVKEDSIKKHLAECVDAGLIVLYTVAGKAYLEMQDFRQQIRAKESKYPSCEEQMPNACQADAKQLITDVHLDEDVIEDEDEDEDVIEDEDEDEDVIEDEDEDEDVPKPKSKLPSTIFSKKRVEVDLPHWLPKEVWQDWVHHRETIKAKLTQRAAELCLKNLARLRDEGDDPVEVINHAILTGWRGLFPLKNRASSPAFKGSSQVKTDEYGIPIKGFNPPMVDEYGIPL